jgi:hypothetical protein
MGALAHVRGGLEITQSELGHRQQLAEDWVIEDEGGFIVGTVISDPASGPAIPLANVQLTNPPVAAFFRLQASSGSVPSPGIIFYGILPVVYYPTNTSYTLQMTSTLAVPGWTSNPSGNSLIAVQITNAPANAVFRLH